MPRSHPKSPFAALVRLLDPWAGQSREQGAAMLYGMALTAFVGTIVYVQQQKVNDYATMTSQENDHAFYKELVDEASTQLACTQTLQVKRGSCASGEMKPTKKAIRAFTQAAIQNQSRTFGELSNNAGSEFYNELAYQRIECYRLEKPTDPTTRKPFTLAKQQSCRTVSELLADKLAVEIKPFHNKGILLEGRDSMNENLRLIERDIVPFLQQRFDEKDKKYKDYERITYNPRKQTKEEEDAKVDALKTIMDAAKANLDPVAARLDSAGRTLSAEWSAYYECNAARNAAYNACMNQPVRNGSPPPVCHYGPVCSTAGVTAAQQAYQAVHSEYLIVKAPYDKALDDYNYARRPGGPWDLAQKAFNEASVELAKLNYNRNYHGKFLNFANHEILNLKRQLKVKKVKDPQLETLTASSEYLTLMMMKNRTLAEKRLLNSIGEDTVNATQRGLKVRYLQVEPYCVAEEIKNKKRIERGLRLKFRARINYDREEGIGNLNPRARKIAENALAQYLYGKPRNSDGTRLTEWAALPDNIVRGCIVEEVDDP